MNSHPAKLLTVVTFAVIAFSTVSEAASRTRAGKFHTSGGRSGTVTATTTRGVEGLHRDRTVVGANGRTATQTVDRIRDREAGTATVTRSATGPKGNTRSATGTVIRTGEGTATTDGTYTRANGRSGTFHTETNRTENGRVTAGTISNANGQSATFNREITREDGIRTATTTTTGPNGGTRAVETVATRDGNTVSATRTVTQVNGEQHAGTVSVTGVGPATNP